MIRSVILASALLTTAPALAQTAPAAPAPAAAVDPARLAKARVIIELTMPEAQRDAMFAQLLDAMTANLLSGMMKGNPQLSSLLDKEPKVASIFANFIARQKSLALGDLKDSAPQMIDALAGVYAKRFTLTQLDEIEAFVSTPTGRDFLQAGTTLFSDPAVAAWQRDLAARAQSRQRDEVRRLLDELKPLLEADDAAPARS